jgi:hypothetical protein
LINGVGRFRASTPGIRRQSARYSSFNRRAQNASISAAIASWTFRTFVGIDCSVGMPGNRNSAHIQRKRVLP